MAEAALPRDTIDAVFKLIRRATRYWWLAAAILVAGGALTFFYAQTRKYKYSSEAVVFYQEGMNFNFSPGEAGPSARRMGQRLRETVLSRGNLTKLIDETKLAGADASREQVARVIEDVRKAIGFRLNEGDTYVISFSAETPQLAQAVTSKITDMLIEQNARMRLSQAEVASEFLDAERTRTEENLRAKEVEVARFLAKHPEFAQDQAGANAGAAVRAGSRGGRLEPTSGDTVLSALRREEARLRQQITNPGAAPAVPEDPVAQAAVRDAETRLATARRELADRKARFTEQHPDVRAAAATVREAEEALKRVKDAARPAVAPEDEVVEIEPRAALQARLSQVQNEIRRREREPKGEPGAASLETSDAAQRIVDLETDWARLNRELGEARERFQALDTRQFAASITAASLASGRAARIVVIDPAYLPAQPVGASRTRVLAGGLAAALFFGLGLAFALALIDDHVYDRRDIDALGLAPVLVEIPRARGKALRG